MLGESAGGNLAALIAVASRDEHRANPSWPRLAGQILAYPAVDLTLSSASIDEAPTRPCCAAGRWTGTAGSTSPRAGRTSIAADDPRVSPIFAADHTDLPPALMLAAGQDPLRDDAIRYAAVLAAAGVPVTTRGSRRPSMASCPSRSSSPTRTRPWSRSSLDVRTVSA